MKTMLLICLMAVTCIGQSGLRSPAFVGQLNRSVGNGLLIETDFEGAGAPSGWSSSAGTPDWDNTSSPIAAAQDLKMGNAADCNTVVSFTSSPEVWMQFEFYCSNLPESDQNFLYAYEGSYTTFGIIQLTTGGSLKVLDGGGASSATADTMTGLTHYWIFFHVLKGTGANAVYDVEFSTTSTRTGSGNKFTSKSDGQLNANLTTGIFDRNNTGWGSSKTYQIDNVKISNTGWPP